MNDQKYTGPTDIRKIGESIHIDGYPNAKRLAVLETEKAHRLADLRLHQLTLGSCQTALHDLVKQQANLTDNLLRAIVIGIAAQYFSCFGKNEASLSLSRDKIFKGRGDAKQVFDYWKALRDKHIIHNESEYDNSMTCVVLGDNETVQDILSTKVAPTFYSSNDHINGLNNLVTYTLERVAEDVTALLSQVFAEVEAMDAEGRSKLKDAAFTAASWKSAFNTRKR